MAKFSWSTLDRCSWLLLPLAGALSACASDTSTTARTTGDSQSSSSDDDSVDDDDDDGSSDDSPEASNDAKSALDGAVPTPARSDAGSVKAPRLDGGSPDAGPAKPADAATAQVTTDASTSQPAIDASTPGESHDAATPAADAELAVPTRTFKVDSKDEWTASGFQVEAGRCYEISTKIDDRWLDLDVPADLTGWIDKDDARLILFEPFRRVAQDDIGFYQFATCVNKKLNQCFPVNTSSTICPKSAGELFFFVNDVSGFESNNVGTASVTIQPK